MNDHNELVRSGLHECASDCPPVAPQPAAAPPDSGGASSEGSEEALNALVPYLQHEPDCTERTPEGDCVCGLATAIDGAFRTTPSRDSER